MHEMALYNPTIHVTAFVSALIQQQVHIEPATHTPSPSPTSKDTKLDLKPTMPRGHYDISGNPKPTPTPNPKPPAKPKTPLRGAVKSGEGVERRDAPVAARYSDMAGERDREVKGKGRGLDMPPAILDGEMGLVERLEGLSVAGGGKREGKGRRGLWRKRWMGVEGGERLLRREGVDGLGGEVVISKGGVVGD